MDHPVAHIRDDRFYYRRLFPMLRSIMWAFPDSRAIFALPAQNKDAVAHSAD